MRVLLDVPGRAVQVVQRGAEAVFGRRDERDVSKCGGGLEMVAGLAGSFEGKVVVRACGHGVAQIEEGDSTGQGGHAGAVAEHSQPLGSLRALPQEVADRAQMRDNWRHQHGRRCGVVERLVAVGQVLKVAERSPESAWLMPAAARNQRSREMRLQQASGRAA